MSTRNAEKYDVEIIKIYSNVDIRDAKTMNSWNKKKTIYKLYIIVISKIII